MLATATFNSGATAILLSVTVGMSEAVMSAMLAVPALMMLAGVSALMVRLRPASGAGLPTPIIDQGSKTAHTVMMHMDKSAPSPVKQGRRRAQKQSEKSRG